MFGLQTFLVRSLMAGSMVLCIGSAAAAPLRYCVEADLPPFSYKTAAGAVEGFDVDFASAVCSKMNMECVPEIHEWTAINQALYAGKCDTIKSSMTNT